MDSTASSGRRRHIEVCSVHDKEFCVQCAVCRVQCAACVEKCKVCSVRKGIQCAEHCDVSLNAASSPHLQLTIFHCQPAVLSLQSAEAARKTSFFVFPGHKRTKEISFLAAITLVRQILFRSVFKILGKFHYHCPNRAQRLYYVNLWRIVTCYTFYFFISRFVKDTQ